MLIFIQARCIFHNVMVMNASEPGIILTVTWDAESHSAFASAISSSHDHQVGLASLGQLRILIRITWSCHLSRSEHTSDMMTWWSQSVSLMASLMVTPGEEAWWAWELLKSQSHSPTVHWRLSMRSLPTTALAAAWCRCPGSDLRFSYLHLPQTPLSPASAAPG